MPENKPNEIVLSDTARIQQAPRVAARTIEGQAVVVVIDDQRLHTLNSVGTFIWEKADGCTFGEIVDSVSKEFEVSAEQARQDAETFVTELKNVGAIIVGST